MNKKDLRVIKTRNTLYNTLVELMKEKTFESIKVSDICNHALINRSTFYAHYNDKYELLEDAINDLKSSFLKQLNNKKEYSNIREYYLELIKVLLDYIDENRDMYLAIMINNRSSIMMDIIYDVLDHDITNELKKVVPKDKNKIPSKIVAKFYLGAVFNVGIEWLLNNKLYTKEEILEYFNKLIPNNLDEI